MSTYERGTFGKPRQELGEDMRSFNHQILVGIPQRGFDQHLFERSIRPKRKISYEQLLVKLNILSEQVYEVIFLKESVISMVGQQRMKMIDFMRELKKYLFKFQVQAERDSLEKQFLGMAESSVIEMGGTSSSKKLLEENSLHRICEELMRQNKQLKQKYEMMLVHYRNQIQSLSSALQKSLQQANTDQEARHLKFQLIELQEKSKQDQARYAERVKYLETEIMGLEDDYFKEKQTFQRQIEQYRERERQIAFQESQLQRKSMVLIQREKALSEREIMLKQERSTLERRETKVSDYQHNQLRRQRNRQEQEKNHLKSEYYLSYDRLPDPNIRNNAHTIGLDTKTQRQRSVGPGRLVSSRVDINARLRQIQMEKKNSYGFKNSRMSEAGGMRSERSSSKNKNFLQGISYQGRSKDVGEPNVNHKLDSMLQSLQRDLNDMK